MQAERTPADDAANDAARLPEMGGRSRSDDGDRCDSGGRLTMAKLGFRLGPKNVPS